jgi:D-amino-acid dehydrogenase
MARKKHVVIIGGGVIGLFCAHYAREAGHEVTILEKNDIGSGSSGGNAGLVVPSHFIPLAAPGMIMQGLKWMLRPDSPFYIKPRLDPALLSWLWQYARAGTQRQVELAMPLLRDLSLASEVLYRSLEQTPGLDFAFRPQGLLMLYKTEHAREGTVEAAMTAGKLGITARILSPDELRDLQPGVAFSVMGGVYYPGDGHLEPERLMTSLRTLLDGRGVTMITGTPVTGFLRSPSRIRSVRTPQGEIGGDEFVLAAGAWSSSIARMLDMHLPMQPGRGYSITLPRVAPAMTIPAILEEARVAITPFDRSIRFAGTMELSGFTTPASQARIDAILRAVPEYYGNILSPEREKAQTWEGYRPCSPDGLPYLGRSRAHQNLIIATGHAMIGTSLGPVTGKIVSQFVDGTVPHIDMTLTNPDRYQ